MLKRRGRCLGLFTLLAATALPASPAFAAPPDEKEATPPKDGKDPSVVPEAAPTEADRDNAKKRFYRGLELYKQGAFGPALSEFLESRRAYPNWSAASYAATCLRKLERYDESLDLFASLIRDFNDKLPAKAKQEALVIIEELKGLVSTIDVAGAEPGASIVVDQRARGEYPLVEPLRVPAGSHIVRVYKEGYEPFEARLDVAGGAASRVSARLRKLKETGTLEVIESRGAPMDVVVDGVVVGKTPLHTLVSPGKHTVLMRGDDKFGTAPSTVLVRVNEVATLRLEAERLSAALRVTPTPFDALVSIDSMLMGRGVAELNVKPGPHTVEVAAEGFLVEARKVVIPAEKREVVTIQLARDPKSPFWRRPPPPPHFLVELSTGLFVTPSFGGDVAGSCAGACEAGAGVGTYGALRGGYVWSSGAGVGATAGYLTARQSIQGRAASLNVVGVSALTSPNALSDSLSLHGIMLGVWAGYTLDTDLPIQFRLGAGGFLASIEDARVGEFTGSNGRRFGVGTVRETQSNHSLYVAPEVRVGLPLKRHVQLNLGLELPILISVSTPRWSEAHAINAGIDGYGWFSADALRSPVLVGFVPTVGGTFDL